MSEYRPIDCELYSRYELAIMRRQALRIAWRDDYGNIHLRSLLPINLQTRNRAEYLLAETDHGIVLELRLDQIIRVTARSTTHSF